MNPYPLVAAVLLTCPCVVAAEDPAGGLGTQALMSIPEAVKEIKTLPEDLIKKHVKGLEIRARKDKKLSDQLKSGNIKTASSRYINQIHQDVIASLLRREKGDREAKVSLREVKMYFDSFGKELRLMRDAIQREAEREHGGNRRLLTAQDWRDVLENTAAGRKDIVTASADKNHPGPVVFMDQAFVRKVESIANRKPGGGQGGGGPSPGAPGDGSSSSAGQAAGDASDHLAWGDVEGAHAGLADAVKNGSAGAADHAMLGSLAYAEGRYADAAASARRSLAIEPQNRAAMTVLQFSEGRAGASASSGERSFMGGQAREASSGAFVRAALVARGSGRSVEQFARSAENAMRLGDMAGAKSHADRGLAASPGDSSLLALRAAINLHQREYDKAAADAKLGLEKDPKSLTLLRAKAFAENRAKKWRDALASANQILEINPNDAHGYAHRAHAYGGMGERDAMMSDISRAAKLNPMFADAARRAGELQLPSDADLMFLFPGETGPAAAPAPAPGNLNRRFGLLVGVSALGGLLLAFGLLQTVLAPLKERVSSVFARLTRTGPATRALEAPLDGRPAGLIRGQYEVRRQIGEGGMGMVYEGTDRSLGRRVAIKKMRDEIRADARERLRFVTEAKTVAALHHPSIVDIYAIAEDGDDVFLVFEYVDGKTVYDLVQASGGLDAFTTGRIVRDVASALDFAHSRGVIHRDMKPSNVMVDGHGRVKVMDFGIARAAKDAMTRYSVTNTIVGTPPYMAPEAEQGQVRRESDVYALAVCAYEMLTGRLPFIGTGGGMMLNKINMSYVPPSRQKEGLPPALDAIFARAFQADPDKRHRTPGEFSAALASALPAAARA